MKWKIFVALCLALVGVVQQVSASEERLFVTAQNGDLYTLGRLLESGVDPNCYYESTGDTPLHHAAVGGQAEAIALLVKYGADVNVRNNHIHTPLHNAVFSLQASNRRVDAAIAILLETGADPSVASKDGVTPLHAQALMSTIRRGASQGIDMLLAAGADPNARDRQGNTVLHWAALLGDTHTELLNAYWSQGVPADLLAYDNDGASPADGIARLLAAGADPNVANREGTTPLGYAEKGVVEAAITALRAAGAH